MKWRVPLIVLVLLVLATVGKVALAGTLDELMKILDYGLKGLEAYLNFLVKVLMEIW